MTNYDCGHAMMPDYIRCPACVLQELDNAQLQIDDLKTKLRICEDSDRESLQMYRNASERADFANRLNGERLRLAHNVHVAYCELACKHPDPRDMRGRTEHTKFCTEVSDYILREPERPVCQSCGRSLAGRESFNGVCADREPCETIRKDALKRSMPAPKCEHVWKQDGDRDVCDKCGTRTNPFI